MKTNFEPNWETAEKLYPAIKTLIEKYAAYCDENGDEEFVEYKKLETKLHEMTGKDISRYNLSEWWEEEGIEVLSFRISLPDPVLCDSISKEEMTEVVRRIKTGARPEYEDSFKKDFIYYLDDYYHEFLKKHFKKYKYEYFNRQKSKSGKYFEYTSEEIVEKIWSE